MALPKLNENLKYEMMIPSSDTVVTYRPYLVKEEKILLQAFESQDQKLAMRAMSDTIIACVYEDIRASDLSTFDVEYMFTQIRAKSVGETSTIQFKCLKEDCDEMTEVVVDLTTVEVSKTESSNIIPITDEISVEMKYPTYDGFVKNFTEGMSEADFGFLMLEDCMVSIMTEDERHIVSEVSKKELDEFIGSMTNQQFEKIGEFLQTVPVMKKEVEFTCSCGYENKTTLEGLQDFF